MANSKQLGARKRVALVAHNAKKNDLVAWVEAHAEALAPHRFWATGGTGDAVRRACPRLEITGLKSGPLGGDQQVGALIAEGELDVVIFFTDALSPHPHDADVQALVRLSTLYDVALATNRTTAEFLISSPLFQDAVETPADGRLEGR